MIDVPVQVKEALREGSYKKNYRFVVLNDDGTEDFTINNDNLVSESVNIDERMVSGDVLKFGLCEGSSLEFQYFDKVNITGRQLKVFVDVYYIDDVTVYTNVEQVSRWGGATVREDGSYRVFSAENEFNMVHITRDGNVLSYTPTTDATGTYAFIDALAGDLVEVDWVETTYVNTYLQSYVTTKQLVAFPIPIGFFTVKNCSRQASTGIIKATAYNKLQSDYLDAKANDIISLLPSDTPDGKVSLYEMKKELLGDYGIIPYEQSDVILDFPTGWGGAGTYDPDFTFKIIGSTYNWMPESVTHSNCSVRVGSFERNTTNLIFESLQSFEDLLDEMVQYTKERIYERTQSPDAVWEHSRSLLIPHSCVVVDYWVESQSASSSFFYTSSFLYQYKDESAISSHIRPLSELKNAQNVESLEFRTPSGFSGFRNISSTQVDEIVLVNYSLNGGLTERLREILTGKVYSINMADIPKAELITVEPTTLPDVTLRELQSAIFETQCQYGQLDRETDLFSGVELNHSRLLPQETLYPASDLYPSGAQESTFKSQYSKLWADEGNVHKWKYLIITYKGLDEGGNEKDYTLQRTVNNDGTDNYNCSDNWLFRNLIWTAEQIGEYADAMVEKMRDITWFPFEMWAAGLPYLETGDEIEIPLGQQSYTSYVLQRQLKGIQNLQDTYINGTLDIF